MHVVDARPKARKAHRCSMCCRTIDAGETYRNARVLGDGTAHTFKECAHCTALIAYVLTLWGETEYGPDDLIEWEPNTLAHLRLKALATRRRWRHCDGSLYPVPELVWHTDAHGFGRLVDIRATPSQEADR